MEGKGMSTRKVLYVAVMMALGLALYFASSRNGLKAQVASDAVKAGNDEIGGVVASDKGPEAGVWVIAETTELGTKLSKTVVTDDRGRYLVPGLPKASYTLFAR